MKKSSKIFAGVLSLSLMISSLAIPAMAEGNDADATASTAVNTMAAAVTAKGGPRGQMPGNQNGQPNQQQGGRGQQSLPQQGQQPGNNNQNAPQGRNNRNMPQAPVNGNQNEQAAPQTPNGKGQNAQAPDANGQNAQTPDTNDQNTQTPSDSNQNAQTQKNGKNGGKFGKNGGRGLKGQGGNKAVKAPLDLDSLVQGGVIDQDTATKIDEYLKKNAPAQPTENGDMQTEGQNVPEKREGEEETTPPEKPEGEQAPEEGATPPELPDLNGVNPDEDLLAKLVEAGILTQDQADTIKTQLAPAETTGTSTETVNG